jgi:hypothetical protein
MSKSNTREKPITGLALTQDEVDGMVDQGTGEQRLGIDDEEAQAKLGAMLASIFGDEDEDDDLSDDEAFAILEPLAKAVGEPIPFTVGQRVMVRDRAVGSLDGEPGIVIEVEHDAYPNFDGPIGTRAFGHRAEVRIMLLMDGTATPLWLEAWALEPYEDRSLADAQAAGAA